VVGFIRPVRVVTVYGRRSSCQMQFHFRTARARAVYEEIVEVTREGQERLRQEIAAP
jgi:hypothetical protein